MGFGGCVRFEYGAITRYGRLFQNRSPTQQLGNSVTPLMRCLNVPQPRAGNAIRLLHRHGLAYSLFARHY